jgi:hypothetical protein
MVRGAVFSSRSKTAQAIFTAFFEF